MGSFVSSGCPTTADLSLPFVGTPAVEDSEPGNATDLVREIVVNANMIHTIWQRSDV